jgi:hypothetical protein
MSGIREAIAILGAPLGITILLILRLFGYNPTDREGWEGIGFFIGFLYYSGIVTLVGIVGFFVWLHLAN